MVLFNGLVKVEHQNMNRINQFIGEMSQTMTIQSIKTGLNMLAYWDEGKAGAIAFDIFCRPRRKSFTEQEYDFLKTGKQTNLFCEGLKIKTYHWSGTGPCVLLAHGWESHAARWQTLIKSLIEQGIEVVALDAPAHGQSSGNRFTVVGYAAFLSPVIQHYGPQILIGHSAGAMAAIYYLALHQQGIINRLAVLGTPAELTDLIMAFQKVLPFNQKVLRGMDTIFQDRFGIPMSGFSVKKYARELNVPGLVIHDMEDSIAPFSGGMAIHQNWKHSHWISTTGLGHSLQSSKINEILIKFVKGEKYQMDR